LQHPLHSSRECNPQPDSVQAIRTTLEPQAYLCRKGSACGQRQSMPRHLTSQPQTQPLPPKSTRARLLYSMVPACGPLQSRLSCLATLNHTGPSLIPNNQRLACVARAQHVVNGKVCPGARPATAPHLPPPPSLKVGPHQPQKSPAHLYHKGSACDQWQSRPRRPTSPHLHPVAGTRCPSSGCWCAGACSSCREGVRG
jgi:hypothetical protein